LFGNDNTVGGTTTSARNTISGNVIGLNIGRSNNVVQGNFIGVDSSGTQPLGNTIIGIDISGDVTNIANNNLIGGTVSGAGNIIAYNGSPGIGIQGIPGTATGNAILGNRIFANATLGIDLAPENLSPNDSGDSDTGPNNLQNFPVLTSASLLNNGLTVGGTLNSTPNTSFRIEFFANPTCDSSGNGEGQSYLGFTNMLTDTSGNLSFSTELPAVSAGQFISATATDANNNTSEFSACVPALITSPPNAAPSTNYLTSLTVTLTWGQVSWAAGYQIEVDDQSDFVTPVYRNLDLPANKPFETFALIVDGTYYWRVRAVQADGKPGTWGPTNAFTIRQD
jgi:titin